MSQPRPIAIVAVVAALVLVAGGVFYFTRSDDDANGPAAGTTAPGTTSGSTPAADTPQAALDAAAARWDATESAHFDLRIEGDAFLDDARTIALRSASGDIARPDLVEATAQISVALVAFDIGIIAIGDEMYQTNIVTGRWERAPEDFGYNPAVLFSPTEGISAVVRRVQSPAFDGTEVVEGRQTRIVRGTLTGADVDAITSGALTGDAIDTRLWIDQQTADIVKVVLQAPPAAGGPPTVWTLVVTNQNEPVEIEAPQL